MSDQREKYTTVYCYVVVDGWYWDAIMYHVLLLYRKEAELRQAIQRHEQSNPFGFSFSPPTSIQVNVQFYRDVIVAGNGAVDYGEYPEVWEKVLANGIDLPSTNPAIHPWEVLSLLF